MSWLVDPLLASKLLPPLLGAVTALSTFLLVRRIYQGPVTAFLARAIAS